MEGVTEIDVESIISHLRNDSVAWANSKFEKEQVVPKEWSTLSKINKDDRALGPVLKNTMEYMLGRLHSTTDYLVYDKFIYDYDVRCNMDRPARFDTECVSLSFDVRWRVSKVRASTYNGPVKPVRVHSDISTMISEMHVKDMAKFAKLTGLSSADVKSAESAQKVDSILKLYSIGAAGQNKLTRLVKGCLLLLDRLEYGGARFPKMAYTGLPYTVSSLYDRLRERNVSYVYSTMSENETYNHFLYAMCQRYPNPVLGGVEHVKIPADSDTIYVVGRNVHTSTRDIYLSPNTIMGFLIQYADDFDMGEELERAMAIACTLRENRYLKHVKLPKVMSVTDLIWPVLVKSVDGLGTKTLLNSESARVLGRYNQMLCLILFKDLDTCLRNTSVGQRNQNVTIRDLCSRDNLVLIDYMQDKACADVMLLTQEMMWLKNISDADIEHMRQYSVFEAFWVVRNPKTVLKNGLIHHFKNGWKNPISLYKPGVYVDPYNTLAYELELAGEDNSPCMPDGGFNISLSCIRGKSSTKPELVFTDTFKRDASHDCEKQVGPDAQVRFEPLEIYDEGAGGMDDKDSQVSEEDVEVAGEEEEEEEVLSPKKTNDQPPPVYEIPRIEYPPGYEVDPDDIKDVDIYVLCNAIDLYLDFIVSRRVLIRFIEQGVLNPEYRARYDAFFCSIDIDEFVRSRGIVYPDVEPFENRIPVKKPSFELREEGGPDDDSGAGGGGPVSGSGPSGSGGAGMNVVQEGGQDDDSSTAPTGEKGSGDHVNEAENEGESEVVEEENVIKSMGSPPFSGPSASQPQEVGSSGKVADLVSSIEKLRSLKPQAMDYKEVPVTPKKTVYSTPLGFGSSAPRDVGPTPKKYEPPQARSKRVGFEDYPDPRETSLVVYSKLTIDAFCHMTGEMNRVASNLRGYLQSMTFSDELKGKKVGEILTDEVLRENLRGSVCWYLNHHTVGVDDYPREYRALISEVREIIASKEEGVVTSVPDEVREAAVTALEKEVLEKPDEWEPSDERVTFSDLKGMHQYMVKNPWWLVRAQQVFQLNTDRIITASDLEWLARYLDDGGDVTAWKGIWALANNSEITTQMKWSEVSDKMADITKLHRKMKKGISFRQDATKKRDALEKLKIGDTMREKKRLKREEQNRFVDSMGRMTLGKAALILAQLVVTRKAIMHEEKYALVYRFMRVDSQWEQELFDMLQDYLD